MKQVIWLVMGVLLLSGCAKNGYHEFSPHLGQNYKGNLKQDRFSGYGEFEHPLYTYKGGWESGTFHGEGELYVRAEKTSYSGVWDDGWLSSTQVTTVKTPEFTYKGKIDPQAERKKQAEIFYKKSGRWRQSSADFGFSSGDRDGTLRTMFSTLTDAMANQEATIVYHKTVKPSYRKTYVIPAGSVYTGVVVARYGGGKQIAFEPTKGELRTADFIYTFTGGVVDEPLRKATAAYKNRLKTTAESIRDQYERRSVCKAFGSNIYYIEGACKDGLAHGEGRAVLFEGIREENRSSKESFLNGRFESGYFVSGEFLRPYKRVRTVSDRWVFKEGIYRVNGDVQEYVKDKLIFDGQRINGSREGFGAFRIGEEQGFIGTFRDDKPYGWGTCYYKGKPERCWYISNGRRMDDVYRMRLKQQQLKRQMADERQRQLMAKFRAEDEAREAKKRARAAEVRRVRAEREAAQVRRQESFSRGMTRAMMEGVSSAFNTDLDRQMNAEAQRLQEMGKQIQKRDKAQAQARLEQQQRREQAQYEAKRKAQQRQLEALEKQEAALKQREAKLKQRSQTTTVTDSSAEAPSKANDSNAQSARVMPEALAYCWASNSKRWRCDGPTQKTLVGEKEVESALKLAGCANPRHSISHLSGRLYFCGYDLRDGDTGKVTWNRDIRGWYALEGY